MPRILLRTRYLLLLSILGLAISAAFFFVFGGFGLLQLLYELLLSALGLVHEGAPVEQSVIIFEIVEYVHTFVVGAVLYITAMGLYQLFIGEIKFLGWLQINSTDELETNLIGVTVIVLAVNFMGAIFADRTQDLLNYGVGIALQIAVLGAFLGLLAWSVKLTREVNPHKENG